MSERRIWYFLVIFILAVLLVLLCAFALRYIPAFNIPYRRYAVFNAVDGHIRIPRLILRHGFKNTARRGEKSRTAFF